jgi:hypothetical protein
MRIVPSRSTAMATGLTTFTLGPSATVSMPRSSMADRRSSLNRRNGSFCASANSRCCCSESALMPVTAIPASRRRSWPATSASMALRPRRAAPLSVGAPKKRKSAGCLVTKLRRLRRNPSVARSPTEGSGSPTESFVLMGRL